jgi:hypothetical protein
MGAPRRDPGGRGGGFVEGVTTSIGGVYAVSGPASPASGTGARRGPLVLQAGPPEGVTVVPLDPVGETRMTPAGRFRIG